MIEGAGFKPGGGEKKSFYRAHFPRKWSGHSFYSYIYTNNNM